MPYDPAEIEPKWQRYWEESKTFHVEIDPTREKYYILDMFPYPSGAGLHVGHPKGYTSTDVLARFQRMRGKNVLHPIGWDAFGLPAERAAVREGIHPAIITKRNTDNFRRQIKRLGFAYDWEREINTSSPEYYRWTQWIFRKLFERGLAYQAEVAVNWCPAQCTVLANEEVQDGKYVETGDPVERRTMRQWMLKITAYAEKLLEDLDELDWPENVKEMQRNWIGKSEGAEVRFAVQGHADAEFTVFTTRPDTLFGATYCVFAPEHPLVSRVTTDGQRSAVLRYVEQAKNRSDRDRQTDKEKTGVFTGAFAINPVNQQPVPIWVADYVLMAYGTGAIMAVPGHDERDFEFARAFDLPIVEVVSGGDVSKEAFVDNEDGVLVNSAFLDGEKVPQAKRAIIRWLEEQGVGVGKVQYRLRDWLFSRQRYWGEPFPVLHREDGSVVAVDEDELPVLLPELDQYQPTEDGEPPLARAQNWVNTTDPRTGRPARRETNTMPQWAGSCWYYLRYLDPHNTKAPFSKEAEQYWMPVDVYVGGSEHTVLHLLYARFWHKVLHDCGLVSTKEPFRLLRNQGMILARSFKDARGKYHYPDEVEETDGTWTLKNSGEALESRIEKMSKSLSNVVNPDDVVRDYGADSMRLYETFMGPLEGDRPWQTDGVEGVRRFLDRLWRLYFVSAKDEQERLRDDWCGEDSAEALVRSFHKTVKKVTQDLEQMAFNTAIAQLMIFVNDATKEKQLPRATMTEFVKLVAPFAPHIAEEIWEALGGERCIANAAWPTWDEALATDDTVEIAVQVNGKLRDTLAVPKDSSKDALQELALGSEKIQRFLDGKSPRKVIVVPGKIVNVVV